MVSIVKSTSWPHIYKRLWFSSWQQLRNASHNYDLSGSIAWQIFGLIWGWFFILEIYDTIYSTSVDCTSFRVAPAVLHPAWASSGQHSSISKEREEKVFLQIRELSIHRRISSFGKQLMATQSKAAQTLSNNNEIGFPRNIDLWPRFSAECWRPVKMIQPQDGLCKNFYQEQERVCITRNFSFERKYLRAMWEILCDERHPFIEFSLWKHALCRREEK